MKTANNATSLVVLPLNKLNIITDCSGLFQEYTDSGKQKFALCELVKHNNANYYEVIPIFTRQNTFGEFNPCRIFIDEYYTIPHKEFDIVSERYKAEGFCNAMNQRLNIINQIESDYKNCWLDIAKHIFWFDGTYWYEGSYGRPFYTIMKYGLTKNELLSRVMNYDWEYVYYDSVQLKRLNIFKRFINKYINKKK